MLSDQHSQHDEGQLHFLGSDDHFMHPDDDFMGPDDHFMGPDEQEEDYYYPGQISRQHSDMEAGESASIEHLQSSDGSQYGYGENSDQFRGNAELYPRQRAAYRRQEDLNSDQGGHYEDEVFGFGSQDMDGDSGQLSCGLLEPRAAARPSFPYQFPTVAFGLATVSRSAAARPSFPYQLSTAAVGGAAVSRRAGGPAVGPAASGDRRDDLWTAGDRRDDLWTSGDRRDDLWTSGERSGESYHWMEEEEEDGSSASCLSPVSQMNKDVRCCFLTLIITLVEMFLKLYMLCFCN